MPGRAGRSSHSLRGVGEQGGEGWRRGHEAGRGEAVGRTKPTAAPAGAPHAGRRRALSHPALTQGGLVGGQGAGAVQHLLAEGGHHHGGGGADVPHCTCSACGTGAGARGRGRGGARGLRSPHAGKLLAAHGSPLSPLYRPLNHPPSHTLRVEPHIAIHRVLAPAWVQDHAWLRGTGARHRERGAQRVWSGCGVPWAPRCTARHGGQARVRRRAQPRTWAYGRRPVVKARSERWPPGRQRFSAGGGGEAGGVGESGRHPGPAATLRPLSIPCRLICHSHASLTCISHTHPCALPTHP